MLNWWGLKFEEIKKKTVWNREIALTKRTNKLKNNRNVLADFIDYLEMLKNFIFSRLVLYSFL